MSRDAAPVARAPSGPGAPLRRRAAIGALLLVSAYAFAFQGSRGLWEPDEGRYTDIASRMLRSGDFVVPAFNHEAPHFAKPPLTYWAIAAGIAVLGWNEWGARAAGALAFAAAVLVVFLLGRRLVPERAWLPAVVYATFLLPYLAANIITTDTLLTLWQACGMLLFVVWWEHRDGPRWRLPLLGMWLAFALAFLTKGPPGLLALLAAAAFVVVAGGWRSLPRLFCPGGLAVFALVGVGWYVLVAATNPGLLDYFVRDEMARRIASGVYRRNAQWYGAIKVYAPTVLLGMLPWTLFWLAPVRAARRTVLSREWWRTAILRDHGAVLLVIWIAVPLLLLSLVRSRLPLYVLPVFVPLALATGRLLGARRLRRGGALALATWALALVGARWVTAEMRSSSDARPLAAAIRREITPLPSEVAFIDVKPVWGLSLYLHCEVERIVTSPGLGPTVEGVSAESLRTELAEREPGALLVIAPELRDEVAAELARLGRPYVQLGVLAGGLLVAPLGDLRRTDAPARQP